MVLAAVTHLMRNYDLSLTQIKVGKFPNFLSGYTENNSVYNRTSVEFIIARNKKSNWSRIRSYDHLRNNPVNEPNYILLSDYNLHYLNIKITKFMEKGVSNRKARDYDISGEPLVLLSLSVA
jgi:hypothetical protein